MKKQEIVTYEDQQKEIEQTKDFIQRNKARAATQGLANSREKYLASHIVFIMIR